MANQAPGKGVHVLLTG